MANTLAPFGFRLTRLLNGTAPNFAPSVYKISSANTTAIFQGDPVTSLSTGYIAQSAAGTTQLAGIFQGCQYLSIAQKRTVWSNYWPGSDAAGDVTAYVDDNPDSVYTVQADGAALVQADIQGNLQLNIGTGTTANGLSGAMVVSSSIANTTTLPFRLIDLITAPPGANGTDTTTSYNYVLVTWNFQNFKTNIAVGA